MLVTSRSFEEYRACFALTDADLRARILDCAAGASGFTAAAGGTAVAVDPAYAAEPTALIEEARRSTSRGGAIVDRHAERFTWAWYGDPDRRAALRAAAAEAFARDLRDHPGRYVAGALPELPFADDAFDLALCSHLLFTWSDRFDEAWHERALLELVRVAAEVRVFPLVVQGSGEPVAFLGALVERLRAAGFAADVERVEYEFQVGGDRMLRLRRPGGRSTGAATVSR